MKVFLSALISCSCLVTHDVWAAQPCPAAPVTAAQSRPPSSYTRYTREVGVVEDTIAMEQGGYQFRAYVVNWHGSRVLVSAPLAQANLGEGDNLHYIAIRMKLPNGQLLLDFVSTERANRPPPSRTAPPPVTSMDVSSSTASGTIEDILSAQDDGYRFVGYVVRYQSQRFALVDHSQAATLTIGDEISFLEIRSTAAQRRLMGFQMLPSSSVAASSSMPVDRTVSEDGVVTEVLTAQVDGYRYRAYVVQWHNAELLLPDESASSDYRVGDTVAFTARHLEMPVLGRLVRFKLKRASDADADSSASAIGSLATKTVSATVRQILAGSVDGGAYSAYIVDWNGQHVGVTDEFATTHYVVGQQIALPVSRIDAGGTKQLQLMLFNFPNSVSQTVASTCQSSQ